MLPSSQRKLLGSSRAVTLLRLRLTDHCCANFLSTTATRSFVSRTTTPAYSSTRLTHSLHNHHTTPTRTFRGYISSPSTSIARFSTCIIARLSNDSISTSSASTPSSSQTVPRNLKALVGLPCPGCGSPFQIDRPQEPGYLTRSDSTITSESSTKQSKNTSVGSKATSMSHAQYEEHLKTLDLDPKILQELMGLKPPPSPEPTTAPFASAESSESSQSLGDQTAIEEPPVEILDRKPTLQPSTPARLICHRCHSLSHHASPLANSSVLPSALFPSPPAPVPKHLETLAQSKTATVVLVVDLIDFPLSLPQPIIDELLKHKNKARLLPNGKSPYPVTPIILVGNKFDVMPVGTKKHKVIGTLQQYLRQHGLDTPVRAIHLVSAKNPVRDEIRLLLKSIGTSWTKSGKGNVVMVGAENVGKSQLMNAFLKESGRWRPNQDQVLRDRHQPEQAERKKKLESLLGKSGTGALEPEQDKDETWNELTGVKDHGSDMEAYEDLFKSRGMDKLSKYKTTVSNVPGTTLERIKVPLSVLSRFLGASYKEVQTKWLMDTPGIRTMGTMIGHDGQRIKGVGPLTSWLTLDELKVTLPKKMLKPASFMLEEGKSFFLGGLVRIDCISIGKPTSTGGSEDDDNKSRNRGPNPAPKLTCFTTLPLHKTSTVAADRFLEKAQRGELTILQPPFGTPERLAAFPGLRPAFEKDVVIVNNPFEGLLSAPQASSYGLDTSTGTAKGHFSLLDTMEGTVVEEDNMTRQQRENAELQLAGQYGICDLVFSGIGWVMISGKFRPIRSSTTSSSSVGGMRSKDVVVDDGAVVLRVWTPMGQGAAIRDVCLLPELAANQVDKSSGGIRQKQKLFQQLEHRPSTTSSTTTADASSSTGSIE
ncbi:hypothetical protein BGZ83_008685 [Gryganskiella cystojenkinii]|nr:hypothetical protein BGZ83_008685 [Gryganskiella cystojenkinii]